MQVRYIFGKVESRLQALQAVIVRSSNTTKAQADSKKDVPTASASAAATAAATSTVPESMEVEDNNGEAHAGGDVGGDASDSVSERERRSASVLACKRWVGLLNRLLDNTRRPMVSACAG